MGEANSKETNESELAAARRKEECDAKYHEWKLARRVEHLPCDVQNWLPRFRELTFSTELIPITQLEAQALVASFRHWGQHARDLSSDECAVIAGLHSKIAAAMDHFADGAFVRLGSRSPKDAASVQEMAWLRAELERRRAEAEKEHPNDLLWRGNAEMLAVADSTWTALRVATPETAMARLQHSERVFEDLLEALEAAARNSGVWDTCIAVRRWEPRLRHDREFRAFVWKGHLTAVSQYNHYVCFAGLREDRDRLAVLLTRYWQDNVAPRMAGYLESYVVDFAVLQSPEEIRVVEVNPFRDTTGAALFDWSRDGDAILRREDVGAMPEFRVLAAPFPGIDAYMNNLIPQLLAEDGNDGASRL